MIILGLHKDPWHNTGAAIIKSDHGEVLFANLSEERCDRVKDSRNFPMLSTEACMKELEIKSFDDIDLIVLDYIQNGNNWAHDYINKPCSKDNFLAFIPPEKIKLVNHHECHANTVFYSSPFERAAILIIDGRGSNKETQSLYIGDVNKGIELVESTDKIGIGLLYAAVTQAIGFGSLQEGKTMGIAPYGRGNKEKIFDFSPVYNGIETSYETVCVDGSYDLCCDYRELHSFEDKAKAAYEVQNECERAMLHLSRYAKEKTGCDYLCISGGVGLNSVANYKILQEGIFKDVFINPAASDTGIPLGAALYGYHAIKKQKKNYAGISPYLGPSYYEADIKAAIEKYKGFTHITIDAFEKAARFLSYNKILGFWQGRSEMGPRALGNRSIIMSPLKAENKDVLNSRVKFREGFRPFAPAILNEYVEDYFIIDRESPYMLFVPDVKENKLGVIPAVTHVDGTGRLQTVKKSFNPLFYNLINSFYKETGVPVLLNTSFNVAGEPVVETPEDAIKCFLGTNIDALLLDGHLLIK
jgi:carbamoyltransferase